MFNKICFRADGNEEIGYGHVMRCLALAEMLKDTFSCCFITRYSPQILKDEIKSICQHCHIIQKIVVDVESEIEFILEKCGHQAIVVIDGYNFDSEYQKLLKVRNFKVVAIDDHQPFHYYADLVINHSGSIDKSNFSLEPYTALKTGPEYAILRSPFLNEAKIQFSAKANLSTVLICFGGADPHDFLFKSLQICLSLEFENMIAVTTNNNKSRNKFEQLGTDGRVTLYENLSSIKIMELMKKADLGICPSSTISIEACAVRLPICTGYYVDNQKGIYDSLINNRAAFGLGNLLNWDETKIKHTLVSLYEDLDKVNQIIKNQSQYIDGYSSERIRNLFQTIVN